MATLSEVLKDETELDPSAIEWLQLLIADWQLIADLSFADLILWARRSDGDWVAVAHVRPNTGQMVYFEDVVGELASPDRSARLDAAASGGPVSDREAVSPADPDIREESIPVTRQGTTVGVLTRHTNLLTQRTQSRLETTYHSLADAILTMIAAGEWPSPAAPTGLRRGAPRVGDGVIHLDGEGVVLYASPNAMSGIHRLGHKGEVVGEVLAKVVADVLRDGSPIDESLALVVTGRAPWRAEVASAGAIMSLRAIPLTDRGVRVGALLLMRDVTELRRGEQEMLTKEATIREIHHRVKNNLQTVAALLRLQSRRLDDGEGRAALDEAVRRVGTIALVHETLSQGFDETANFDEIATRGLRAVVEVATSVHPITSQVTGTFGRMHAEDATALAMVISELVQNAADHGLAEHGGNIVVEADRSKENGEEILRVAITDNGTGLPAGFRPPRAGLGTRIVTSLVQDLRGRIRWEDASPHGTRVRFHARLRPLPKEQQSSRPGSTG